jgi:hypothetical protein
MTTTEALDRLATRLVQAEKDIALMEDALDHAEARRQQMQNDLDTVVETLTKLVINTTLASPSKKRHVKRRR